MIKIGVTGVIGSGKSTAVKYFSSLGVPVFIADDYAKKLMNEDDFLKSEIIKLIGDNAYQNNVLNRKYISDVIFKDEKLLKSINDLVHPKVKKEYSCEPVLSAPLSEYFGSCEHAHFIFI